MAWGEHRAAGHQLGKKRIFRAVTMVPLATNVHLFLFYNCFSSIWDHRSLTQEPIPRVYRVKVGFHPGRVANVFQLFKLNEIKLSLTKFIDYEAKTFCIDLHFVQPHWPTRFRLHLLLLRDEMPSFMLQSMQRNPLIQDSHGFHRLSPRPPLPLTSTGKQRGRHHRQI